MKRNPMSLRAFVLSIFWMLALVIAPFASAQSLTVSGTVSDPTGEVLIGVSVSVKGDQKIAVATDYDGHYQLSGVPADGTLVFSYVGFQSQEQAVKGRTTIDVTMHEDSEILDEVVVVGYGSLSRKELSSSIVQVNADDFMKGAMNNPMEMLTGKVAGLNVSSTASADPNASADLQIRGATSLETGNGPLIVIDGVAGGDIRTLAPQDIESMSVLKDAASAAIYGTRGANGVILITTKKGTGEPGLPLITYDSYAALTVAKSHPEYLTPNEYRLARRGADYGASTDWYDLISRDVAYDTNQYIAIDGSLNNGGYYTASVNYKKANGLDLISGREEFGGRAAVSANALDSHLRFTATLNARKVNETWGQNVFNSALTINPTFPVYNEDGSFYQPTSPTNASNPLQRLLNDKSEGKRNYILGTGEVKYNIWSNDEHAVSASASYSHNYNDLNQGYYSPSTSASSFWNGYRGTANMQNQKWWTNQVEVLANYSFKTADHDVKFVGGYSWSRSLYESMYMQNSDFSYDKPLWWGIGSGTYIQDGRASMSANKTESTLVGFFGRINYSWKGMIIASASIRREGSTKFGADKKWGNFPSASIAWEMAKAPFLSDYVQTVQSLKPRISYGVTGRSDFNAYQAISTYSANGHYLIDGAWMNGYRPSNNANPYLGWEKLSSVNVGVDFMFFNRLYGSIDYFDRRSMDLLYNYTAPQPPYVYSSILVNVGTIKNTGMELTLTADAVVNQPVTWTTGINYSYSTTKLTKLSNDIYKASYIELMGTGAPGSSEHYFRVEEGGQVGQFYFYEYAGYDENHNILVYNKDGEQVLASTANPEDKRYVGNGAPKHFLTWTNTLKWKSFDLSMMFNGAFGFQIFNNRRYGSGLQLSGDANVLRTAYTTDKNVWSTGGVLSSYFLEKGDYFKLENVTLGYTLPLKNRRLVDSLRLYLSAKNLFTLTKYTGTDPSAITSTGITPGVDNGGAYPQATQLTLGVTLRFR